MANDTGSARTALQTLNEYKRNHLGDEHGLLIYSFPGAVTPSSEMLRYSVTSRMRTDVCHGRFNSVKDAAPWQCMLGILRWIITAS